MTSIDLKIRPATASDSEALTALSFASKRYWDYPDSYFDVWKNELTVTPEYIEKNRVFAAKRGNDIIGYFSIAQVKEDFHAGRALAEKGYWLEHFFVAPEYIRKGVGTRLLDFVVNWCRENGIGSLKIFSDPNAAGFYEKHGAKFLRDSASSIEGRKVPVYEFKID
jgi:GNAT superfamily N-acetyltransferase